MEQKKRDLKFGLNSEKNTLFKIRELFGEDIERTNQYDIFDYENESYQIELKTRRKMKSSSYYDIMIGLNKIEIAEKTKNKISVFLWKLNDGLFVWKFNKNQYSVRMGGRCDRGRDERRFCAYVPIKYLGKV